MNILFICSGNICRSPLAEAVLRDRVARQSPAPAIRVQSAGTGATPGLPLAVAMEMILQEQGISSQHSSQRLNRDLMDWADLLFAMTRDQKALLLTQSAHLQPKLFTLKEFVGDWQHPDINDPYGSDLNSYRHCATEISAACDRLLQRLQQNPSYPFVSP